MERPPRSRLRVSELIRRKPILHNIYYARRRRWLRAVLGVFLGLSLATPSLAGEWITSVGLGVHSYDIDQTDVTLENPIFIIGIRYEWRNCMGQTCMVRIEHHSGVFATEDGAGYNLAAWLYEF